MPQDVERAGLDEPSTELGQFLREHREEILERWIRATRAEAHIRDLDERHLVDHLPVILDEIAEALERAPEGQAAEPRGEGPAAHAMEREQLGFTLPELVTEYRLLRRCILGICCTLAPHLVTATVERVNDAVDRALERSVERFAQERERTLQTLDALAEAAPTGGTLDDLLQGLLSALVERVRAVDGASLFLREGEHLRLRAAAGLSEPLGELTLEIGEGFAGAVAARREPQLTHSAASDPRVKSGIYRRLGVRALYGVPLLDERGETLGVTTIASLTAPDFSAEDKLLVRTITRRATALIAQHMLREAAEERSRRLRHAELLMSVHPDVFTILGRDHRLLWANPALLKRWGKPLNEAVGRTLEELGYEPAVAIQLERNLDRALRGETLKSVAAYTRPGGETGVYEYVMAPIRAQDGTVEAAASVTRDVSERFQAEKARADALVRERSAREEAEQTVALLDSVLSGSPAGIAFLDRALRFVRINGALAKVTGRPVGEHIHRKVEDIIPGPGSESINALMQQVLDRGETVVNFDIPAQPPSTPGVTRDFLCNFFPVRVASGEVIGVGVITMEITDRKRMEEELRRAVTVRERVMSILSHDLRSPLSVVTAGAAMLRRSPILGEQELRTVARITRAADRMARMIHDLLDYARATGGGLRVERASANVRDVVRNAVDELRAGFPGAQIRLDADGVAPEGEWDADRLTQLLTNLLSNAVQYSPAGSPVDLRVSGGEGEPVTIEVRNGGDPIPADTLPGLFEPFQRGAASDHASPGGLGLGLFIVKQIAEGHGGTVAVRSSAAEGTTFTVTLPRR
ncbi:MAG TPA: PAS domain-containing protein [Myxococcaceae bacterium]|nr:PAS domain-containing protein [Myxococcaceae bacterium]